MDTDYVLSDSMETLFQKRLITLAQLDEFKKRYIRQHPNNFIAVFSLSHIMYRAPIDTTIALMNLVRKSCERWPTFRTIEDYVSNKLRATYKISNLGDSLVDMSGITIRGDSSSTRNIRGKAILVYFWYSGCGPCRQISAPLKSLYTRYHDQGLEIVSFSVDEMAHKADWIARSEEYDHLWMNLSDLGGINGIVPLTYQISAMPAFMVFDRSRKLVLSTSGNTELPLVESTVARLLK
ncbi:MAG: TlpA family protein disulfide reductase [Bacteroidetes bacterium]|nr:TlpA family protein disulfide reductase [Bacteroidota bacterium]